MSVRQQLDGAQRAIPPARTATAEAQEAVSGQGAGCGGGLVVCGLAGAGVGRCRALHGCRRERLPPTGAHLPSCASPCLIQYTKLAEDKWYPGKIIGGKEKQESKKGESGRALPALPSPACLLPLRGTAGRLLLALPARPLRSCPCRGGARGAGCRAEEAGAAGAAGESSGGGWQLGSVRGPCCRCSHQPGSQPSRACVALSVPLHVPPSIPPLQAADLTAALSEAEKQLAAWRGKVGGGHTSAGSCWGACLVCGPSPRLPCLSLCASLQHLSPPSWRAGGGADSGAAHAGGAGCPHVCCARLGRLAPPERAGGRRARAGRPGGRGGRAGGRDGCSC